MAEEIVEVLVTPPEEKTVQQLLDEAAEEMNKEREVYIKKEEGYRLIINELVSAALLQNREMRRGEPYCCCGASIEKPTREEHREVCIRLRNMLNMLWGHFEWVNR